MTPVEYENLVNQILDKKIDLDKLTELVEAEGERREQEAKKDQAVTRARKEAVDAMIEYIGTIMDDAYTKEYLASAQCRKEFTESLESLEKAIKESKRFISKYESDFKFPATKEEKKEIEDNVREWLKKKNRVIQF